MNIKRTTKIRLASLAVVTAAGVGGAAMLSQTANAATAVVATAATTPTDPSASTGTASTQTARDPSLGGHVGANGVTEVLLTGDVATKASAAALAAVPGGTIERVENDAEGATYEAHMVAADGSHVTVKMDANFTVTATEQGH